MDMAVYQGPKVQRQERMAAIWRRESSRKDVSKGAVASVGRDVEV